MRYLDAPDLKERLVEIVAKLGISHIDVSRVACLRSFGSSSRRTLARCHTVGKLMQRAMGIKAFYAIEFLEPFEKLNRKEQDKVIIHELLHIPKTFGGGFRHHDYVCEENVDLMYEDYQKIKGKGNDGVSDKPNNKTQGKSYNRPKQDWRTIFGL